MSEFKLPDVGEGLTEAEIVSWKVQAGDTVEINDVIVEIETAKSLVELPSPFAGTVLALMVPEGETVPVGTPIISIGDAAGTAPTETASAGDAPADAAQAGTAEDALAAGVAERAGLGEIDLSNPAASGGGEGESLVGRMKAERGPMRRPRKGSASPSTESAAATQMQVQGAFSPGGAQSQPVVEADEPAVPAESARPRPANESGPAAVTGPDDGAAPERVRALAKPPVRKLAKDLGLDLAELVRSGLTGSGPQGSITREDVLGVVSAPLAGARGSTTGGSSSEGRAAVETTMPESYADLGRPGVHPMSGARESREPVKGVRKMMAAAMVGSAFTIPHVTELITVDVTRTVELVDRLRERRELGETKVSPLLVLAKAAMLAMRRTPEINSFWDEDAQEVVYKGYVNLGIAAATPRGLVVPNVKDADALSLPELAAALTELAETARAGRTQPAEMSGGTFTITNVGVFGVDAGTPIINPGESAILCFGAINKRPWVDAEGELCVRQVTTLALSFDHRHIDGARGSRFLADVAAILEDPATSLLF